MKIHAFSDMHLEFQGKMRKFAWHAIPECDVVVDAGDTHPGVLGVMKLGEIPKPVIKVPGNHDFWGRNLYKHVDAMKEKAHGTNVHVLYNDVKVINNVRFVGTTLWVNYALHGNVEDNLKLALTRRDDGKLMFGDYRYIYSRYSNTILPSQLLEEHEKAVEFLTNTLSTPHAGPTVVVTHHGVHKDSFDTHWRDHPYSVFYASDMTDIIKTYKPEVLIHGHIHKSSNYKIDQTQIVCNPFGYMIDNKPGTYGDNAQNINFNPNLVIEV